MKNLEYGRNSLINGLMALSIISLTAFGCVCDDLDEAALDNGEATTANEVLADDVVPSNAKAAEMVKTKVLEFADAFESGDYAKLHSTFSKQLQEKFTPQAIENAFKPFVKSVKDKNLNLRSVESLKPEFLVKPFINDRRLQRPTLFLIGHYVTEPIELDFEFQYIFEDNKWKLVSPRLRTNDMSNVQKNDDKYDLEVPPMEEIHELIETDLRKVKYAVDQKDFSSLHKHVSKKWQQQSTPSTFEKIFSFSGKAIALGVSDISDKSPKFTLKPHINIRNYDDPSLILNGYYETSPNQVSFEFRYISEDGKWKLVGISVSPGHPTGIIE